MIEDDEARSAFREVWNLLEGAGLLAGNGKAHLLDLWHLYQERDAEARRMAEVALLRACPECDADLEEVIRDRTAA